VKIYRNGIGMKVKKDDEGKRQAWLAGVEREKTNNQRAYTGAHRPVNLKC